MKTRFIPLATNAHSVFASDGRTETAQTNTTDAIASVRRVTDSFR